MAISCEENFVNIYVTHHEELRFPISYPLIPLDVTRRDGENIASLTDYCELRGHYYIWKNMKYREEDYIGFFHPRRYLDFQNLNKIPYTISKSPKKENYNTNILNKAIMPYDIIVPIPENIGISVRQRYSSYMNHRTEDMFVLLNVIKELYPSFFQSSLDYLENKEEYYCNMYVMKKAIFEEYSSWLFRILMEYDKKNPHKMCKSNGYLGERLLGIFITHMNRESRYHIKHYPRKHYYQYDDNKHSIKRKRIELALVPLNSKRRLLFQRIKYNITKENCNERK